MHLVSRPFSRESRQPALSVSEIIGCGKGNSDPFSEEPILAVVFDGKDGHVAEADREKFKGGWPFGRRKTDLYQQSMLEKGRQVEDQAGHKSDLFKTMIGLAPLLHTKVRYRSIRRFMPS